MLIEFEGKKPFIEENVFIAPTAVLIGDVHVEKGVNIWFGAVIRADFGKIVIGAGSSIQDNSVIHVYDTAPTLIGKNVTVGHGSILEGCLIGDGCVIGMNAVVLPHAKLGEEVMVAAGSVIKEGADIPSRVLAAGTPAEVKKELNGQALRWIKRAPGDYQAMRDRYLAEGISLTY